MTKALILDFGGVITRTLFETHALTEAALGLKAGTLQWRGPFEPDTDPMWISMQNGEITERDYWCGRTAEVGNLLGQDWTEIHQFVRAARGADPHPIIRPEFLDCLAKCKASGIKLAILSNELDLFYGTDFREKLPFLSDFDVIHDATYTEILKPDPRAFQECLKDLALEASECVFVDDQKKNIDGAKRVGLPTVHFDVKKPGASYEEALTKLNVLEGTTI